MTFPDFFIFSTEQLFFIFNQMLSIGSFGRHEIDKLKTVLHGFSLTVKAVTLILISGRGSAISSAKLGKSGSIYYLVKS